MTDEEKLHMEAAMKKKQRDMTVVTLAYWHHHFYLIFLVGISLLVGGDGCILSLGVGFLFYAAYTLVGYKLRWKHIYCSFSIPHRTKGWKMKTNNYNWKSISKAEVYVASIIWGLLGIGCLAGHFLSA